MAMTIQGQGMVISHTPSLQPPPATLSLLSSGLRFTGCSLQEVCTHILVDITIINIIITRHKHRVQVQVIQAQGQLSLPKRP